MGVPRVERAQNMAGGSEVITPGTPPAVQSYTAKNGKTYTQIAPQDDKGAPVLNREAARLWKSYRVRLVIEQSEALGAWDAANRLLTVSADHLEHGNFTITLKHEIDHMEDSIADASGADSIWQASLAGYAHRRDSTSVLSNRVSEENAYNAGRENEFGRRQGAHMIVSEIKSFGLELEQLLKNVPAGSLSLDNAATATLLESAENTRDIARIVGDGYRDVLPSLASGEADVESTKITTETENGPVTHHRHEVTAKGGNVRRAGIPVTQHNLDMVESSTGLSGEAAKIEAAKRKVQAIISIAEEAEGIAVQLIALIQSGGSRDDAADMIEWLTDMLTAHNQIVPENKVKQGRGLFGLGFMGL